MRIAFYAPLKAPDHPTPSGDRRMAQSLLAALRLAGHEVELASRFRSWDGAGDGIRQERLRRCGCRLAERLLKRWQAAPGNRRPELWFTYHLYHKAPDWLGPRVSGGLGIPYVVAEASHAEKQRTGDWAAGWQAAAAALRQAQAVFTLNENDRSGLQSLLGQNAPLIRLLPFLDHGYSDVVGQRASRHQLARRHGLRADFPWLLAVAMLRPGDKLASLRLLAAALGQLLHLPWQLVVVGDGPARAAVRCALRRLGPGRAVMVGRARPGQLAGWYGASDVYVWPARNEAYGMALLEAQSAGLPVVAGRSGGVSDIVRNGITGTLVREGDAAGFAGAVARLLRDAPLRRAMGSAARRKARTEHSVSVAAGILDRALTGIRA